MSRVDQPNINRRGSGLFLSARTSPRGLLTNTLSTNTSCCCFRSGVAASGRGLCQFQCGGPRCRSGDHVPAEQQHGPQQVGVCTEAAGSDIMDILFLSSVPTQVCVWAPKSCPPRPPRPTLHGVSPRPKPGELFLAPDRF